MPDILNQLLKRIEHKDENIINELRSGYNYAWYGACEQSVIDASTHAVKGAKIGIVDVKTGEVTPIDGAVTDENGNATVNIDKAGNICYSIC